MHQTSALIGTRLVGRYDIGSCIGEGGVGAVYRADDIVTRRQVALKVLRDPRPEAVTRARFLREARLAARISHRHVARVSDFGRWGPESDRLYIAMELIRGLPLSRLLARPQPPGRIVALMDQVLDALAHVHARGVLHRDIKPDNILVSRRANGELRVKVVDFGIATVRAATNRITGAGVLLGTPAYMAPEQADSSIPLSQAADLYAVGTILYQAIAGKTPFTGRGAMDIVLAKATLPPSPPEVREGVVAPPGLVDVIIRLLAREPLSRYEDAAAARRALAAFMGDATATESEWSSWGGDPRQGPPSEEQRRTRPGISGAHGRLWGRSRDLARLKEGAAEACEGRPRVLLLSGDAGVGKSVMLGAFATKTAELGTMRVIAGAFRRDGAPGDGLRAVLAHALGVHNSKRAVVRPRVEAFLRAHDALEQVDVSELVRFLVPSGDAEERSAAAVQRLGYAHVLRVIRLIAATRPVLLALDDLHNAPAEAVAFLEYVQVELALQPCALMIVGAHRPDPRLEHIGVDADAEDALLVHMALDPPDAKALARGLALTEGVPLDVAREAVERCGGNPLFAWYLCHAVAGDAETTLDQDAGQSRLGPGMRSTGARSGDLAVPNRLREIVEQGIRDRLDGMPRSGHLWQRLVQLAILGDDALLHDLLALGAHLEAAGPASAAGRSSAVALGDDVEILIEVGLVTDAAAAGRVGFVSGLTRDVLLGGLATRARVDLHAAAAAVLMARVSATAGPEAALIARHLEGGGQADASAAWHVHAFEYASSVGEANHAAEHGLAALELMPSGGDWMKAAVRVGQLLRELGDLEAAERTLRAVVAGSDDDLALLAGEVLAEVLQELREGERWGRLVDRLKTRATSASPAGKRAYHRSVAYLMNHRGEARLAARAARSALDECPPGAEAHRAALRLAWSCLYRSDIGGAEEAAARALVEAKRDPERVLEAQRLLAAVAQSRQENERATELYRQMLASYRARGLTARVVRTLIDLGFALATSGEHEAAQEMLAAGLRSARDLGLRGEQTRAQLMAAYDELLNGRLAGLPARLDLLEREVRAAGLSGWLAPLALARAGAWAADGDLERVERIFESTPRPSAGSLHPVYCGIAAAAIERVARAVGAPEASSELRHLAARVTAAVAEVCEVHRQTSAAARSVAALRHIEAATARSSRP